MKYLLQSNFQLAIYLWIALSIVNSEICPESGNLPYSCVCKESTSSVVCNSTSMETLPKNLPNARVIKFNGNLRLTAISDVPYGDVITLHFEANGIKRIEDYAFKNAKTLKNLHISHEKITEQFTQQTFAGTEALVFIDIENIQLYEIKAGVFGQSLPNITEVKLQHCGLYNIEDDAFADSNRLQYLGLQFNNLARLPLLSVKQPLRSLTHLQLSNNQITTLENLQNMPALTHLMLENNKILEIDANAFNHLAYRINFIDLHNNDIKTIDPLAFIRLSNLSELDLNSNNLKHMTWEELPWNTLSKIALYDNPWVCDCQNAYLAEHHVEIDTYNHDGVNRTIRCGSPKEVQGKAIYDVEDSYFLCADRPHQQPKHTAAVTVIVLVCLFLAIIGIVVAFNMRRWKRQKKSSQYTHFSARDEIIKYTDDEETFDT